MPRIDIMDSRCSIETEMTFAMMLCKLHTGLEVNQGLDYAEAI